MDIDVLMINFVFANFIYFCACSIELIGKNGEKKVLISFLKKHIWALYLPFSYSQKKNC